MKAFNKYFILLFFVFAYSHGQQQANFLLFESNMSIINPAFTGSEGSLMGIQYRSNWIGVENAPKIATATYHSKEKNNASWGVNLMSDKVYVENQGNISIDYSYKLMLSEKTKLNLGIKAGGVFNNIDLNALDRVVTENNVSLNAVNNYINPLIGLGAYLSNNHNFLAISIPNILNSKRYKDVEGVQTTATDRPHIYVAGGLNIKLYKQLSFRPTTLYRIVKDAPGLLSVMGKLDYGDEFELGVGLTNNDYLSTSFLFKGKKNLDLGIGYEFSQRKGLSALRENTMEFVLRYRFSQKDKTSNLSNQNTDE